MGCHALLQGVFSTQALNPSMSSALQVDSLPLHLGSPSEQREEQDSLDHFYLEPTFSTHPLFYPEFISNKDEWPNIWKKKEKETEFSFLEIQKMLILSMVNWALEVCLIGPTRCLQWTEAVKFIHAHLRCVLQTTQPECLWCNFLCPNKNVTCKLIYHLPDLLSHDSGYHGIIFRVRQ